MNTSNHRNKCRILYAGANEKSIFRLNGKHGWTDGPLFWSEPQFIGTIENNRKKSSGTMFVRGLRFIITHAVKHGGYWDGVFLSGDRTFDERYDSE